MFTLKPAAIVGASVLDRGFGSAPSQCDGHVEAVSVQATQRLVTLSSGGSGLTNVGTSDGKIGRVSVHGALRAVITATPPKFRAAGTLFYAAGSLRYKLAGTSTAGPNGSVVLRATGAFTGGTGAYAGAHGTFTGSGTKPANAFETFTLKGKVSFR